MVHIDNSAVDAVAADFYLPAKDTRENVFAIPPGGYISVLAASTAGNVYASRIKHA